ncbi:MAG: glycoside hydrolase [Actinobacteria bacterium]|nr:glycoside hydrolase [Actinomycetota bacterium]
MVRRAAVAAALVGLVGLSPGAAGAQTVPSFDKVTFTEPEVDVERLTAGVHMTKDETAPTRGFSAPMSMAVKPDDPRVIVAATANLRNRTCHLLVSTDAGQTWHFSKERPVAESYPNCTSGMAGVPQASLAWGSDGTLYYGSMAYGEGEGARNGVTSIALARTTDLGETWNTTIVADARAESDPKPEYTGVTALAVDTSGDQDAVYVGFSRSWRQSTSQDDPLNSKRDVLVAASTDGGNSFGELVNLNDHSELTMDFGGESYPLHFQTAFGRPFMTVHDGVILAVADGGPPNDDPPPEEVFDGIFGEALPMLVARSTDQGRTWTVSELSPPLYNAMGSHTGMGWTPEGGPEGTFVFAYSATPGDTPSAGKSDIVVQRSTDGGVTWTEPLAINDDDPADDYTSFYPQLDVAPNGRVDVVWQDNRERSDYLVNVRYSYSTDGGATWAPNIEVTDQPVDFNLGISFNSDIRQGPGVASTNEYAAIGWADPRFADEETQTQDNFGVIAQFSPLPSETNTTLLVVAAVLGGLLVAGLVLLVQAKRRRA